MWENAAPKKKKKSQITKQIGKSLLLDSYSMNDYLSAGKEIN